MGSSDARTDEVGGSRLWPLLVVLVAASTWHLLVQLHRALAHAQPTRDYAIFEINVQQVLQGTQWVGPYSQWFHHPGPAYFYWLALPYALAGKTTFSLYAAAQLLTVVFVLGAAAAVCRWARSSLPVFLFVPLLALEMGYLGDFPLFDFWPPYVLFFGYGLFVFLCAGLAAGHVAALVPTALVATLLVQTHVAYAPVVVLGLVLTGALVVRSRVRFPSLKVHVGLTVVALVLLWFQPIYVELFGDGDNFRRLYQVFFERPSRSFPMSALFDRMALELSGPLQLAFFGDRFIVPEAPKHFGAAKLLATLQLGALLAGWWQARKRSDRFSEALCLLCVASIVVAAWSLSKVRGAVAPHHTAWVSILGFVAMIAAAAGLGWRSEGKQPRAMLRTTGVAAAWAGLVFAFPIRILPGVHANLDVAHLASSLVGQLRRDGIQRPRIAWGGTSQAANDVAELDWAGAVMLQLDKRGVSFFMQTSEELRWMIGAPRWEGVDVSAAVVTLTVGSREAPGRKVTCIGDGENYFMRYPVCAWLDQPSRR